MVIIICPHLKHIHLSTHLFIHVFDKIGGVLLRFRYSQEVPRRYRGKHNMIPNIKNISFKQETKAHKHDYNTMRQTLVRESDMRYYQAEHSGRSHL